MQATWHLCAGLITVVLFGASCGLLPQTTQPPIQPSMSEYGDFGGLLIVQPGSEARQKLHRVGGPSLHIEVQPRLEGETVHMRVRLARENRTIATPSFSARIGTDAKMSRRNASMELTLCLISELQDNGALRIAVQGSLLDASRDARRVLP